MRLNQSVTPKTARWKSLYLALTIALVAFAALERDATTGQPPADYRLVWSDEFNSLQLGDRAGAWLPYWRGWGVRHLSGNNDQAGKFADDEPLEGGITAAAMLKREGRWGDGPYLHEASDGTLELRAYPLSQAGRAKTFGFPFIAAMISGERQPAQNQGYWETRLRINRLGDGMHLGVWLLNDEHEWPPEIDILEVVGLDPALFHANTHVRDGGAPYITGYRAPNGANGWHVFGFEWTDDHMRWTVDGKTVREHENVYGDDRLYFLVSWEIGGKWPGMPTGNTPWPGEVEIDYVRLYEKVPAGETVTVSIDPAEPTPSAPAPSDPAPEPEIATEAPPPASDATPEPVAAPEPTTDVQPAAAEESPVEPEQPRPPEPIAEVEATTEPQPTAEPPVTEVTPSETPQQGESPAATEPPPPAMAPTWSMAWQDIIQHRLDLARNQVRRPGEVPRPQPRPNQEMRRSLAEWLAMPDRSQLFRFAN